MKMRVTLILFGFALVGLNIKLLMKLSEVATRVNLNSDQLDAIAARIGSGTSDPEIPAELQTALERQDASIAALEAKVPPAPPAPPA